MSAQSLDEAAKALEGVLADVNRSADLILANRRGATAMAMDPSRRESLEQYQQVFALWAPMLQKAGNRVSQCEAVITKALRQTRGKVQA